MMNKFIFLLSILFFQNIFSQNSESIYFDADWKVTAKKTASYYRLIPMKEVGKLALMQDFYINGTPQFEGYTLKNDENAYVGDIVWYDENGSDTTFRQYINTTKNPALTYYHSNGKIRKKVQYKSGLKDGETVIYDHDGGILMTGIYKDGKPTSGNFETLEDDYENNDSNGLETTVGIEPQNGVSENKKNRKTVTHQIFWTNSKNLAQEKVYALTPYNMKLVQQKNYERSGKLIQTIDEKNLGEYSHDIINGKQYEYFLHNNFATEIKSLTNYIKERKNGKAIFNYPNGKVFSETNYKDGSKEGEEIIFNENGSLKNKRIYKDDQPFSGNFSNKIGEITVNENYENGKKEGEATAKNAEDKIIAKGIYRKGEPFNGTFIIENDDYNELINVENFKKTGLQKVFNYSIENLVKTYTIKNEKLNGVTTLYKDEKPIATLDYRDDEPYEGKLIDGETVTLYKNGKISQKTIYKAEYDEKIRDQIAKQMIYENGNLAKVKNSTFSIAAQPMNVYEGIYKNEKPFSGYFVTDGDSEFQQVDFYENGSKKFQYSNDYLKNMENYRFQEYNIKSTYKDGKIFDGAEYVVQDRQFITKSWKNGVLQSFDWDLFAVNYFNRIHFELKNNSIAISDLQAKKKAVIKIETSKTGLEKQLFIDGKKVDSKSSNPSENGGTESLIFYYIENEKIISKKVDKINEPIEPSEGEDLFYKVYLSIPTESSPIQTIFNQLAENIGSNRILDGLDEENILTGLRTDSTGEPQDGILITPTQNETYNLKLYFGGKLLKNLDKIPYSQVEEEVKNLEKDF